MNDNSEPQRTIPAGPGYFVLPRRAGLREDVDEPGFVSLTVGPHYFGPYTVGQLTLFAQDLDKAPTAEVGIELTIEDCLLLISRLGTIIEEAKEEGFVLTDAGWENPDLLDDIDDLVDITLGDLEGTNE